MSQEDRPKPVYTAVVCKTCRTRVFPSVKRERHRIKCPDCFEPVEVPSLAEVEAAEQQKNRKRQLPDPGSYGLVK